MEIDIPDDVEFFENNVSLSNPELWMNARKYVNLCFMHAVQRAIKGIQIETRLTEDKDGCDVCNGWHKYED